PDVRGHGEDDDGVRPRVEDGALLRRRLDPAHVPAARRHLLGGARPLHPVRRRQVAHRSAVYAAGGEGTARPPRLGRPDVQRDRGARQPRAPVLDASAARHPRSQSPRHRRLRGAAVRRPRADGALSRLAPELHIAMKPRVLVTREISPEALTRLKQHCTVDSNQQDASVSPRQLLLRLKGKSGLVSGPTDQITEAVIAKNPQLKIVCNVAVGYNNFDIAAATKHGVMMTNTPGVLDDTTADLTWALILSAARGLSNADRTVRAGRWKRWRVMDFLGQDVYGKTIGICGFGRIGRGVARRAMGFGMKVLYASRSRATGAIEQEFRASYVDKQTLLR